MQNLQTKVSSYVARLFSFVHKQWVSCFFVKKRWRFLFCGFVFCNRDKSCLLLLQIDEKQNQLSAARKQLKAAKADHKASHDDKSKK